VERERLILGIDPGSIATGFGLVTYQSGGRLQYLESGVIRTSGHQGFASRLKILYDGIFDIISEYHPEDAAFEEVFLATNVRAALKLGHARAAVLMAAINSGLDVFEYSPLEIKKAVVGYGRAEKQQVQKMVTIILNLRKTPPKDASDALAVAVCHAHSLKFNSSLNLAV
jgi:crossover junction endodeoxyribonuclease RuvC